MNPTTSTVLVLEQDTLFLLLRVELQLLKQAWDHENSSSQGKFQGPSWPRILGRSDLSLQDNKGEVTVR